MKKILLALVSVCMLSGCAITKSFGDVDVDARGYAAPDIMFYHKDVNGWANPAVAAGLNARVMFGIAGLSTGVQFGVPLYMPLTLLGHDETDSLFGTSVQVGVPFRVRDDDVGYWTLAPVMDMMSYTATKDAGVLSMARGTVSLGVGVEWDMRRPVGSGNVYLWSNMLLAVHFKQFHTLTINNAAASSDTGHVMVRLLPRFGVGLML